METLDLERRKEEIRAKAEAQIKLEESALAYTIETGVECSVFDSFISFKPKSIEDVQNIINTLKPYSNTQEVKGATITEYIDSPYRIDLKSSHNGSTVIRITYNNIEKVYWIKLPIEWIPTQIIEKFAFKTSRNVTDIEAGIYFANRTLSQIAKIRIPCYTFRGKLINWYGGGKTLLDGLHSKNFIEDVLAIKTKDFKY